ARAVLDDVARDLTSPDGAFYSAEDADSPSADGTPEEGAFYVWSAGEIASVLGAERARAFDAYYGVTAEGNFEHGKNVLHASHSLEETARTLGVAPATLARELTEDRTRLLAARAARAKPHLDDKVLASWNGLMISAYARAASVLGSEPDLERARRAADFAWSHLWNDKTRALSRRYRDGDVAIAGELSDYAFLAQGFLDLFEAGFQVRDLERALALSDRAIERFWDPIEGGFFDTAEGADPHLFVRSKEAHDGAEPSGNSVLFSNLARLAALTGRADLADKARRTLDLFASHAGRSPLALTQLWGAAYLLDGKPAQVLVCGAPGAPDTRALLAAAARPFRPDLVILFADGGEEQSQLAKHLEYVASVRPVDGRAAAYLCENYTCGLPITSPEELTRRLASQPASAAIP
ncbi:MAG TPA: thioredoxin domain-containing protein, partial [Candidatus Eisenbacteria bacterium]|nr:thioredoxin domain-containing protein [Candidatus Eisenbacteria bacterium]